MTSQMFYYENNAFGIDTIFVIVDFYLNTSSCSKISKDYGISILRYTNVEHYLNQSDPYYNMSAPPNTEIASLKYFTILKFKEHKK